MDYAEFKIRLASTMVTPVDDPNFVAILPAVIDYAEGRMYRELQLLSTVSVGQGTCTPLDRQFTFPSRFIEVDDICTLGLQPGAPNRVQLDKVSLPAVNAMHGSSTGAGQPKRWAPLTDQTIVLGPWPDQAYYIEVTGKVRPDPLSGVPGKTTTFLTLYLPDAFHAAAMIFAAGWQKNFGSQADDPKMAQSWETQYQSLMASVSAEEMRRKFNAPIGAAGA